MPRSLPPIRSTEQFRATQRLKSLFQVFTQNICPKTHYSIPNLKSYPNTFTKKQAVKCILKLKLGNTKLNGERALKLFETFRFAGLVEVVVDLRETKFFRIADGSINQSPVRRSSKNVSKAIEYCQSLRLPNMRWSHREKLSRYEIIERGVREIDSGLPIDFDLLESKILANIKSEKAQFSKTGVIDDSANEGNSLVSNLLGRISKNLESADFVENDRKTIRDIRFTLLLLEPRLRNEFLGLISQNKGQISTVLPAQKSSIQKILGHDSLNTDGMNKLITMVANNLDDVKNVPRHMRCAFR